MRERGSERYKVRERQTDRQRGRYDKDKLRDRKSDIVKYL